MASTLLMNMWHILFAGLDIAAVSVALASLGACAVGILEVVLAALSVVLARFGTCAAEVIEDVPDGVSVGSCVNDDGRF